jgi:phosphatidate cytidylyltransferase
MKRVITAVIIIPPVLAAVLWAKPWIFSLLVGAVALLAVDEFLNLAETAGFRASHVVVMLATAMLFVAFPLRTAPFYGPLYERVCGSMYFAVPRLPIVILAIVIATAFFILLVVMRHADLQAAFAGAGVSLLAIPYIAFGLGALVLLKDLEFGPCLIFYLFIVVWSGDIFAYYIGRAVGRHHMAPRISPKKTWEGTAASFVFSVVLGTLFFRFAPAITAWMAGVHAIVRPAAQPRALVSIIGLSAVLNVVAQLGDLFESFFKRAAGVKDSGRLVPGHGGVLDRIDALLFAAPLLYYWAILANL